MLRPVLIYVGYSRLTSFTELTILAYGRYIAAGKGLRSSAFIAPDGRISVSLNLKHELPDLPEDHAPNVKEFAVDREWKRFPKMNIVIMIVGSRG